MFLFCQMKLKILPNKVTLFYTSSVEVTIFKFESYKYSRILIISRLSFFANSEPKRSHSRKVTKTKCLGEELFHHFYVVKSILWNIYSKPFVKQLNLFYSVEAPIPSSNLEII